MKRWNVECADAASGTDRVVSVEAATEDEAVEIARGQGLLVAGVYPSLVQDVAAAPQPPQPPPAPTLDYQTPGQPQPPAVAPDPAVVPAYWGLLVSSRVIVSIAAIAYVAAGVVGALGALALLANVSSAERALAALGVLAWAGSAFVSGAILHGLGAALAALRDIARNSFKL
jgi:hypothetical protein